MDSNIEVITRDAWIPTAQIQRFTERVTELNKRATRLKCTPIIFDITDEKETVHVPAEGEASGFYRPAYQYETTKIIITGNTPKLNGWQVIGKIEHDPELSQNVVYELGENKLPESFREKAGCCDHCGVNRPRSKTYVIKKDDEIKQVGSTCLKDFTGHQNPEHACHVAFFIDDAMGELSEFGKASHKGYIPVEPYLQYVANVVLIDGYISARKAEEECVSPTSDIALKAFDERNDAIKEFKDLHPPSQSAIDLAKKAIEYIRNLDRNNYGNFENNLITFTENGMINQKYYRSLAYAVPFYLKEIAVKKDKLISNHIGTEGEKINVVATLNGYTSYETDFGIQHLYIFHDNEGNKLIWKTGVGANININDEYKITATVKSHGTYMDELQTNIIRPKFETTKEIITEALIEETKNESSVFGVCKGREAIDAILGKYRSGNEADHRQFHRYYQGAANISIYLSYEKNDKIEKQLNDLNTHQMLLLAEAMIKTGYAYHSDTAMTKKFFKNHKEIVEKIDLMYNEQAKQRKPRKNKSLNCGR